MPKTKDEIKVTTFEVKEISRYLKVKLTDDEVLSRSQDLTKALDDKGELEDSKKSVMADFKSRETMLDAQINTIKTEVRDRCVHKDVVCEMRYDFENACVTVLRTDTWQEIENRDMAPAERQMTIG